MEYSVVEPFSQKSLTSDVTQHTNYARIQAIARQTVKNNVFFSYMHYVYRRE